MNNWNLTYLFKDDAAWESEFDSLKEMFKKMISYRGKLANEKDFIEFKKLEMQFEERFEKIYQYASLKSDLNKKDVANATAYAKVMNFYAELASSMSFEEPELLSIGKDKIMSFIDNNKELEELRFGLEKMFRQTGHILDEKSEQLLARLMPVTSNGRELYSALAVADSTPATITLKNGKSVTVTQGNWTVLEEEADNDEDRKKIFEAIFAKYDTLKTTFATIYNQIINANKANAANRNYNSILESYLHRNAIPEDVFTTLVKVASTKNDALKKYIKLRQKYLGLEEYHTYNRFMKLASSNKKYTYDQAKELFFDSIKVFPQDFQDKARLALEEGFVDVYEKEGKRSGAYSSSVVNSRPFILLNYTDSLEDVFTVAQESGHSIHSLYAAEAQPASLQDYTIFVAEIASTFNEHRLLDYLIESGKATKEEKIVLLQKAIDSIMSTFYRQTLFANYEYEANMIAAKGGVINHEVLSNIMIDLYNKYYGIDINKEVYKKYVWCYIPHLFYTPFYVYQYATSFAASLKLYQSVKNGGAKEFDNYIGLLKAGGSDYPVKEALAAGVDFTNEDTFMAVVNRMEELVDELEKVLAE